MGIDIFSAPDSRSALMLYKCVFQIPNLKRRDNDNLPHGSYRNRGCHKRYVKTRNKKIKN